MKTKNSWGEVTLKDFLALGEIEADEQYVGLPIQKRIKQIEVISDYSYDDILQMNSEVFGKLLEATNFLLTEQDRLETDSFKLDGKDYMIVENEDISAGEMISLEQLLLQASVNKTNTVSEQLAILIRPAKRVVDPADDTKTILVPEEFKTETLQARADYFLDNLTVPFFIGLLLDSLAGVKA